MDILFNTDSDDQPHAHAVLASHVSHRTTNVFTALATVGLIGRKVLRSKTTPRLVPSLLRGNAVAVLLGIPAGVAMTELRMEGKSDDEWTDRSYRLLNNAGQNQLDRWSIGGALAGFSVFGLTTGSSGGFVVRSLGGAGLGSIIGIASFAAYSRLDAMGLIGELKNSINKM
ncbi:hypothetical protein HDU82_006150 [Entophlyctis luteolus]|nr:hypothetical protein HDU82_006150 [Entophlyctis luteolus]